MYQDERQPDVYTSIEEEEYLMNRAMSGVFLWMFYGLTTSAVAAWATIRIPALLHFVFFTPYGFYGLLGAEIVLVMVLSWATARISSNTAGVLFFLFAIVNGMTLSCIFLEYDLGTISIAFFTAAGMFAITALYGYITENDLQSTGSYLLMALFGIILASVMNFFLGSTLIDTLICFIGIFIFIGLTAYHTQKIKLMLQENPANEWTDRIIILGALSLYLDLINIFLKLLRILGRGKKR